jgi:hypothetical protein
VLIPLILALFPARYTETTDLVAAIGWYALAKVFEHFDRAIFNRIAVSGHTWKRVASAAGACWILRMLERRQGAAAAGRRLLPPDRTLRTEARRGGEVEEC